MGKSGVARQSVPLKKRSIILRYLVIVVPFWLSAKFFLGPYQDFVRTYFAAVLFLLLLALIVQMILPKVAEKRFFSASSSCFLPLSFSTSWSLECSHLFK